MASEDIPLSPDEEEEYFDWDQSVDFYDDMNWSYIEWEEFRWSSSYTSQVNWGCVEWDEIDASGYQEINYRFVEYREFRSTTYSEVNWGSVQWNEFQWSSATYVSSLDWGNVQWNEVRTTSYRSINWGSVQYAELDWSGRGADAVSIDWGSVEWNEIRTTSYRSISWGSVQYAELDWSGRSSDAVNINWGSVEWKEMNVTSYRSIEWEYVQFSEMDSADLQTVRTTLTKTAYRSVTVEIGVNSRDNLRGDNAGNELFGLKGNDTLDGRAGNGLRHSMTKNLPASFPWCDFTSKRRAGSATRGVFAALSLAIVFFAASGARAETRTIWDKAQIKLPSNFFGNYSTDEETGQEEFLFGVPSATFDFFGWVQKAPRQSNSRSQSELARHLKSSLRSKGYRLVPKTEKWTRGRWRADFNGKSGGGNYRRQVSILPVKGGYFVVMVSAQQRNWGSRRNLLVRSVADSIRAK